MKRRFVFKTDEQLNQARRGLTKELLDSRDDRCRFPDQASGSNLYMELYPTADSADQTEHIMAAITAAPSRQAKAKASFRQHSTAFRAAMLAAAALALMLVSSLVTARLINTSSLVQVQFRLEAPDASTVSLAADFTNWSTKGYELTRQNSSDVWIITVPLRKNRIYTYNFVIDGERWIADPAAGFYLEDGLGGLTSFITL